MLNVVRPFGWLVLMLVRRSINAFRSYDLRSVATTTFAANYLFRLDAFSCGKHTASIASHTKNAIFLLSTHDAIFDVENLRPTIMRFFVRQYAFVSN